MNARPPHDHFEELAVGHALSALEPEDEQEFLRHLRACALCERDLAVHRQTLAQLAAADEAEPPASLWQGIRQQVETESGPAAFAPRPGAPASSHAGSGSPLPSAAVPGPGSTTGHAPGSVPVPVGDLAAARRSRLGRTRLAAVLSAAAAAALVLSLGVWNVALQRDRDAAQDQSQTLAAAVGMLEAGPGRIVPLRDDAGRVNAVAVWQEQGVSMVVGGLTPNDVAQSTYVLWGKDGEAPVQALTAFDVRAGSTEVLRDLPLPAGARLPELLLVTREPGRALPTTTQQTPLAVGRAA